MPSDYLDRLERFLPVDISGNRNQAYIDYHTRALDINSREGLYTFGYFAWHILWMSFLQKIAFYLYHKDPSEVLRWLSADQKRVREILKEAHTPYDLSEISEKVLCQVAKHTMIAYHKNKVDNIVNLVRSRDHIAHCSGVLDLSAYDIENEIRRSINIASEIQERVQIISLENWGEFVASLIQAEKQYPLIYDAIIDYLSHEFLSVADIEYILDNNPITSNITSDDEFQKCLTTLQLALITADKPGSSIEVEDYINQIKQIEMSEDQKIQLRDELVAAGYSADGEQS